MEAGSVYVALEEPRLDNFVRLSAAARLRCKYLGGLQNGDVLPFVDQRAFKSVLVYLDGNEALDQILLDEPSKFQTRMAKLWWLSGQLDLPRLQNELIDFARDLYIHALRRKEDYPIDVEAFEVFPASIGPCQFTEFLVAFHGGLLAKARLTDIEINRTLRYVYGEFKPAGRRIENHCANSY